MSIPMSEYAQMSFSERMELVDGPQDTGISARSNQGTSETTCGIPNEEFMRLPTSQRMALYAAEEAAKKEVAKAEEQEKQEKKLADEPNPHRREYVQRKAEGKRWNESKHLHDNRLRRLKQDANEWDEIEGAKRLKEESIARPEIKGLLDQITFAHSYCADDEKPDLVRATTMAEQGRYEDAKALVTPVTSSINERWAAESEQRRLNREATASADENIDASQAEAREQLGIDQGDTEK